MSRHAETPAETALAQALLDSRIAAENSALGSYDNRTSRDTRCRTRAFSRFSAASPWMQSRAGGLAERLAGEIAGRRYQGFANAATLPRL